MKEAGVRGDVIRNQKSVTGQPVEAEKGKNRNVPLKPLEGAEPCQHLDFSPIILISDF